MRELNLDHLPTRLNTATKTINGVLEVDLKRKYGRDAVYHMKRWGHLNNIGTKCGVKPGTINARRRIIEGKSIIEWARELGVPRDRVVKWFKRHGTMQGCAPGNASDPGNTHALKFMYHTPDGVMRLKDAITHYGISPTTIIKRCKSDKPEFKNWYRIKVEETA
jgi:hypothetical protein